MKRCPKCGETKRRSDFRRDRTQADGLSGWCRVCRTAYDRNRRQKNAEAVREAERLSGRRKRERYPGRTQAIARESYERHRERHSAYTTNYQAEHPEKNRARSAVYEAIKSGRLVRPDSCPRCERVCKPDAHHNDYEKPLDVEWLCRRCHKRFHAAEQGFVSASPLDCVE